MPIFLITEQRCKTGTGIESRKTKPVYAAVATHQRASLRVAKKSVVLDLCSCLRHSDSLALYLFGVRERGDLIAR